MAFTWERTFELFKQDHIDCWVRNQQQREKQALVESRDPELLIYLSDGLPIAQLYFFQLKMSAHKVRLVYLVFRLDIIADHVERS